MNSSAQSAQGAAGLAERSLARRIAAAPHSRVSASAEAKVSSWLSGLDDRPAADAICDILRDDPQTHALLLGFAEYAPHLWDLVAADAGRFLDLLKADPDLYFPSLLTSTEEAVLAASDEAEVMRLLRRMKAEAALLIAMADIGEVWPVMRVTQALTELADMAVRLAVHYLLADAARRGKLAPADRSRPDIGSGYIVLAMGKMGGFELNYSSDIDLIVFFDPAAPAISRDVEAQSFYIRVTRGLVKLLQSRTADGYVFRVDLRLRPDPASTHAAISTPAALEYYETRGQNWERSAMIKARPCAGDIAAGDKLIGELSPFVWRKYMDFVALADIHAMKRQINAYKGHGEIAVAGHNIKLGRGGIREIEFFVQTQQLIAGGRHPELRGRSTLSMLHTLAEGGWIATDAARELETAYHFLRRVEHRLQMMADEQTHTLPDDPAELEAFARFLGFPGTASFSEALLTQLRIVQRHYARLFEQAAAAEEIKLTFPSESDDRETLDKLAALGFAKPLEVSALVRGWLAGTYAALKGEVARAQLTALVPLVLSQLARTDNRDAALQVFDRFLNRLHAGAAGRLFSLLQQNRELLSLILLILATAPRLADTLSHQPQVMDGLLDPKFFGAIPDRAALKAALARSLDQSSSYEDFLDRLRLFGQEHMFLIGARILSGTVFAGQAGDAFARLAEVMIEALHQATERRFAESHGRIQDQATAVLALGKLGGREMTAGSDLDLILVYDFDADQPQSDGGRSLYGGHYFARFTQRLINALTAPTNYGALYQVDMRLRPSGRSGPVATQIGAFKIYQEAEAWTWEHMALTRARVVSASPGFGERVESVIREVLCRERDADVIAADAVEMRHAIAKEKGEDDIWDLKYAAGGLIDLEFIAQYLQLVHAARHPDILDTSTARALDKAARLGLLSAEDADVLRPAARLYHDLSQILRLCLSGRFDPKTAGPGLLGLLARAGDDPDFPTLEAHLTETQARVRKSFVTILGNRG